MRIFTDPIYSLLKVDKCLLYHSWGSDMGIIHYLANITIQTQQGASKVNLATWMKENGQELVEIWELTFGAILLTGSVSAVDWF